MRFRVCARTCSRVLATILALAVSWTSVAQQSAPVSKNEAAVKRKAGSLAPNAKISVIPFQGDEEFGTFTSNDLQSFTFLDVDSKVQVTLKYADVKKIKDGYGGYNSLRQRHTDRTRATIISIVVVGALVALVAAVATAKD